jgi:beta-glucanase (GH16 family)
LNHDSYIYQTAHSDYTINGPTPNSPTRYVAPQADVSEYNIYSAEWDENSVTFMVNGVTTLVYPRMPEKGPSQYPWIDNPMYIILSMQIGGGWVGSAIPDQYPIKMDVDYVRVYSATPMAMDMISFANLAANWLQTGCGFCGGADLSGNGNVDVADLQVMAENWLADI